MNNIADVPLVDRSVGGRHGGGASLTAYGKRLMVVYREIEHEYQQAIGELLSGRPGVTDVTDARRLRSLSHRMSIHTSARNQFAGPITGLSEDGINTEVRMTIDGDAELTATVTSESAENLGLAIGREVHALIKASSVIITTDEAMRSTARNQLWGETARISHGCVNSEVTIGLQGGRSLTAMISHERASSLELAVGKRACGMLSLQVYFT